MPEVHGTAAALLKEVQYFLANRNVQKGLALVGFVIAVAQAGFVIAVALDIARSNGHFTGVGGIINNAVCKNTPTTTDVVSNRFIHLLRQLYLRVVEKLELSSFRNKARLVVNLSVAAILLIAVVVALIKVILHDHIVMAEKARQLAQFNEIIFAMEHCIKSLVNDIIQLKQTHIKNIVAGMQSIHATNTIKVIQTISAAEVHAAPASLLQGVNDFLADENVQKRLAAAGFVVIVIAWIVFANGYFPGLGGAISALVSPTTTDVVSKISKDIVSDALPLLVDSSTGPSILVDQSTALLTQIVISPKDPLPIGVYFLADPVNITNMNTFPWVTLHDLIQRESVNSNLKMFAHLTPDILLAAAIAAEENRPMTEVIDILLNMSS
jgi:hypothetical protein